MKVPTTGTVQTSNLAGKRVNGTLRWLALGATVGPLFFIITFLVLGLLRSSYDPIRQQISVLGVGPYGIWLDIAFVLGGLITFVGIVGIQGIFLRSLDATRRLLAAILFSIPLVGMVICGFFPIDSGTPMHIIGANIACAAPIITFLITGILFWTSPRFRIMGIGLVIASVLTAFCLWGYLTSAPLEAIRTIEGGGTLGLWERILVIEILFWYIALSLVAFVRRPRL